MRWRAIPGGQRAGSGGEGDVVAHRQVRKEPVVLEHHADRALLGGHEQVGIAVIEALSVERDMACGEHGEAGQCAEQGRLARSVGTEHSEDFARGDGEVDIQAERTQFDRTLHDQSCGFHRVVSPSSDGVAHADGDPRSQRSRSAARTITATSSRTRLSAVAASGSVSKAL